MMDVILRKEGVSASMCDGKVWIGGSQQSRRALEYSSTFKRSRLRQFGHLIMSCIGHVSLEETPGYTKNLLEGLDHTGSLGTSKNAPGGAGICARGEGI